LTRFLIVADDANVLRYHVMDVHEQDGAKCRKSNYNRFLHFRPMLLLKRR
jgi:hypothetical protein